MMNYADLIESALHETGVDLAENAEDAVAVLSVVAAQLAGAVDEPGFEIVLRAARDMVALRLGVNSSLTASAADSRIVGIIQTILLGLVT